METGRRADDAARALAWIHRRHDQVCERIEPWAHGTVVRAAAYPSYWDFNLVRVEEDPGLGVEDLIAIADEALEGLSHRRIDFDDADLAEPLRAEFRARGWLAYRIVLMRHESDPPALAEIDVEQVPYEAVDELRLSWHREDFPDQPSDHHAHARAVALLRNALVLAIRDGGDPVAFAQIERLGGDAEITQVYVHPEHRDRGLGTALTAKAIGAVGPVRDLWIAADDEDRPKELYSRLGFRPVVTTLEVTRMPTAAGS